MFRTLFAALALILAYQPALSSPHQDAVAHLTPPSGRFLMGTWSGDTGVYDGVETITPAHIRLFEQAAGRRVNWVTISSQWFHSRRFPTETARWIIARGSTPYVRLMMRSSPFEMQRETTFTLQAIARGDFDADLTTWGQAAAALGVPMIAEYGTEVNGEWFPWNGRWNGRAKGPARFRAAFRHIVEVTRAAGATNIVWVFHVNYADWPQNNWNRLEAYYPGDDVVDWIGVSMYSNLNPNEPEHTDFVEGFDETYARLQALAPNKPVILSEFGTDIALPIEPAGPWADRALGAILGGRWPRVIGFNWWNETWPNDDNQPTDLRVWQDPALAAVFRRRLAHAPLVR